MAIGKIRGIYTALCTPITKDGGVSGAVTEQLIDHVIDGGNRGLVVLGGTGEYCALTNAQRVESVRLTMSATKGRVPVVAGVICPGLPESIEMGNKCKELGVDALMAVTPYYVVAGQDGIFEYYRQLQKNVSLPIILYNIPYRTGVNMLPETVERLLDADSGGQIIGIKECCTNMSQVLALLNSVKDRISVLTGEEFLFYQEVSCGAEGAILATSNLFPRMWTDVFESIKAGKLARASEIILRMTPVLRLVFAESNPGPLKEAMKVIGIDCGDALLPLLPPGKELAASLRVEIDALLNWYKE